MTVVLAIDPGAKCGWARWDEKTLIASGRLKNPGAHDVECVLRETEFVTPPDEYPPTLVIEDQYHARMRGKGLTTLMRRRFRWEIVAELRQWQIEAVHPMTWQSHFQIKRGDKSAILYMARLVAGKRDIQPDEADAILIGWWWVSQR